MTKELRTNRSNGKANILILSLVLIAALLLGYIFFADSAPDTQLAAQSPQSQKESALAQSKSIETKKATAKPKEDDEPDLYLNREMQAQVLQVADLYEQNAKYPVYSIPVVGERFAKPVEPFEEAEVDSVYPRDQDDLENPLRIAASVERLRYYEGEQIVARLIVSGGSVNDFSQVNAFGSIIALTGGREIGLRTNFQPVSDGDALVFSAVFDTRSLAAGSIPREAMVKATVSVDGETPVVQTVPFSYNETTAALLENVMPALQEGPLMKIPLEYSVQHAGYYFVDAFLDDASTGQALLQLKAEGPMNQGNSILTLNAHIAALRDVGSEGPYRLRVVNTFLAGVPGQSRDLPARVSQPAGYHVEGIPFSQYEDTPYFDPEVQERLDFLREVGNSNSPESAAAEGETATEAL